MRLIYLLLTFLLFNTNANAQLLAMYQKMRTIREKNLSILIKKDSIAAYEGNSDAQYKYGLYLYLSNDTKGMDFLKKSAKQNNPNAMGIIAENLYLQNDQYHQREAYQMFKSASELHDTLSICYLGICNYWGHGTQKNYEDAVKFLKTASYSKQSYIRKLGLFYLSKCYRYGRGIKKCPYVSNVILLDYELNSSIGQIALFDLSYASKKRLLELKNQYTNAPSYLKKINNQTQNGNNTTTNSWMESERNRISNEQGEIFASLTNEEYDKTMLDLEKSEINDRLELINNELESYEQLCSEEAKGGSSTYYHLVSVDDNEVEVCDENRFYVNNNGIEYNHFDKTVKVISFNPSEQLNELSPGQYSITLSNGKKCEIKVTSDTDFTYKVYIKQENRHNTYTISKKCNYQATFGLG